MEDISDREVISVYSRVRAIEDGMMLDISDLAKVAGFKYPTVITQTLKVDIETEGMISEVLGLFYREIISGKSSDLSLIVMPNIYGDDAWLHIGPGDNGEPVLTLMRPSDW